MKYKKYLSLLLTAVMLVCFMPNSPSTSAAEDSYESDINILKELGIFDIYLDSQTLITRSLFFDMVASIVQNTPIGAVSSKPSFGDLPSDYEFFDSIELLRSLKLVIGDTEGNVNPDAPVSAGEAVTVLVRLSGRGDLAAAYNNGYTGFHSVASDIGILKGIRLAMTKEIHFGEACRLLLNTLRAEYAEVASISGNDTMLVRPSGKTVMFRYLKTVELEGIVTDSGLSSLTGQSNTSEEYFLITDKQNVEYKLKKSSGSEELLLGRNVRCYVHESNPDVWEVRYLTPCDNTVSTYFMEELSFRDGSFFYELPNGTEKKIFLSPSADILKNGGAWLNVELEKIIPVYGTVSFIDNNKDNRIDLIEVYEYEDLVIGSLYADTMAITDIEDQSKVLRLEDCIFRIRYEGEQIGFADLITSDILSVAKSPLQVDGKDFYTINVSKKIVSGVVDSIEENTVYIDGFPYRTYSDLTEKISLSETYTIAVDFLGNAVRKLNGENKNGSFAYLVSAQKKDSALDDTIQVKLFTEKSCFAILDLAQNIKISGYEELPYHEILSLLCRGKNGADTKKVVPRMVKYKVNSANEINRLSLDFGSSDTTQSSDDDFVLRPYKDISSSYNKRSNSINGEIFFDNSTLIFNIPENLDEEDYFRIRNYSYFVDAAKYDLSAYNFDSDTGMVEAVVTKAGSGDEMPYQNTLAVVQKVVMAVDDNGDTSPKLYVSTENGETSLMFDTTLSSALQKIVNSLNIGDCVRYDTNAFSGKIDKFERVLNIRESVKKTSLTTLPKADTGFDQQSVYNGAYLYKPSVVYGVPLSLTGSMLKMRFYRERENDYLKFLDGAGSMPEEKTFYYRMTSPTQIQVVTMDESGRVKIKSVSELADLKTQQQTQDYFSASRVLMKVYDGIVQDVIIYNLPAIHNRTYLP